MVLATKWPAPTGLTSGRSSAVKVKLDALGLVENEDYHLQDVLQVVRPQGGGTSKNVYMLTPEAFKKCLMRAQRRPKQKVDPVIYCDYYLLLEKTYKLYTDYQLKQQSHQLEQKDQELEHQAHQIEHQAQTIEQTSQKLEEQKRYVLHLNEMLIDSTKLPKTQVVYIATSRSFANQNRFKVGGVESLGKLESRLCTYNSRSSIGDPFYYAEWFLVHKHSDIETRLGNLLGKFREKRNKEMYVLNYAKLLQILEYIVNHYNEETDEINDHLAELIASLDPKMVPVVPEVKCLKSIKIESVGQPTVKIEANTDLEIVQKLEEYFTRMDSQVTSVTFKSIFDALNIKRDRLQLYPKLLEIREKIRPDVVVKKK